MTLKRYWHKRDFAKTPEPKGKVSNKETKVKKIKQKHLFIIQKHAASHLHYDFRIELKGVLKSWAVPKGPCLDPSVKRLAMHVEDHPIEYGSFQGIIPKGQYGGGTVMLWDEGSWECVDKNPQQAYLKGDLKFYVHGKKLHGLWKLIRIKADDKAWLLIKGKDEYAQSLSDYDVTIEEPNSVTTQQTMSEIAQHHEHVWTEGGSKHVPKRGLKKEISKKKAKLVKTTYSDIEKKIKQIGLHKQTFPKKIAPMLATLVDSAPDADDWLHEIKFDGYRMLACKQHDKTKLLSRNNLNWTAKFDSVVTAINALPVSDIILDGEIVVLNKEQRSNFQLLQNAIKENRGVRFNYYIFDILYYDKYDLTTLSLIERKNILAKLLNTVDDSTLRYSDHIIGSGKEVFAKTCGLKLEGIISKKISSPYLHKRSKQWLKIKCLKRQEFVICGFTKPQGSRKYFGALLLGTYNAKKELIYNGNVGTGFTQVSLKQINSKLTQLKTGKCPFNKLPPASKAVTWVKPKLIAEVEFIEWTNEGYIRHPSFKGLRTDKPVKAITEEVETPIRKIAASAERDKSSTAGIKVFDRLTSPEKILYKEDKISKQALAEYYDHIKEWILPYIIKRPLTLVRCPEGYDAECFYQKHLNKTSPAALYGIKIKFKEKEANEIYIKNIQGLIALVQIGTLEIHPWGSTISRFEHPDILIFDIDPDVGMPWKKVVEAAFAVKALLDSIQLKSFIKSTGGKGLHVVVPIKPHYEWDKIKSFTQTIAKYLAQQHPESFTHIMSKTKRLGKVYIDYLRNQRGATAIAPYSTRARLHAPVATPLHWDELSNDFADTFFTVQTITDRLANLKSDPWHDFFKLKQTIKLSKLT